MNIRFPKDVIVRAERYDFSDDGNSFRGYLYKDTIPITYLRKYGEVFCSIRMDYLLPYEDYRKAQLSYDAFNGVMPERFNMVEFLENCEQCYLFYKNFNLPQSKLNRLQEELAKVEDLIDLYTEQQKTLLTQIDELKATM